MMTINRVEENGSDVTEDDVAEQFIKSVNSCKSSSAAYVRKANPHKNGDFQKLYDDLKSRKYVSISLDVSRQNLKFLLCLCIVL